MGDDANERRSIPSLHRVRLPIGLTLEMNSLERQWQLKLIAWVVV